MLPCVGLVGYSGDTKHILSNDVLIFCQVIQHNYIWRKYFLHSIVQLIPLLMNLYGSVYISVADYVND